MSVIPLTAKALMNRDSIPSEDPAPVDTNTNGNNIAGIVFGVMTLVVAILALFKGWECLRRKKVRLVSCEVVFFLNFVVVVL